jgi:Nickel responsive protein SCO4226-like
MTDLILERGFDPPLTIADVHERVRSSEWCFDLHRVDWHASFLAADGRSMVCSVTAPDAESARVALRTTGADVQRLWTASVHEGFSRADPNVLIERSFQVPEKFERLKAIVDDKAWCLEQHRAEWVRSFLSTDGRRMVCLYRAPDIESVRVAQREAGLPFERLWGFTRVGPDNMPR